ncbi:hypothetical protein RM553_01980 [Zunongwangia sp. F363]|uniref:Uncharacterized protein n=1 Tax=Autumnicola tepida TaxID=3075595 RepID=A0ABU3C698_9FLAO|nr:hypothetical protein [Zunongwangia sp. F363]MDT0641590.1 hypothetical protein [Zunongwangia sp. F363]
MIGKIFFMCTVTIFFISKSWSQDNGKLCVCFDQSKYMDVRLRSDSTYTDFKVVKEGFESKIKRARTTEKSKNNFLEADPEFYLHFYSVEKPDVIESVVGLCQELVELNKFRKSNYKKPSNTFSNTFIFLKKLPGDRYLKWEVMLEPEE